jgi:large subunit ribosomal protein L16|uniref:Ribosomal protein L16 n=1 Tax=Asterionella formosa TaxID=210441 RepID=A0A1J0RDL0_9STRA|nr:ribosomal protein L16 [Asterionella formosa]APD75818.1 ribosomal protein L16 [Asterionella formosa]
MLFPKKLKFKKVKKGKLKKYEYKSNSLKFGTIGLKAMNSGFVTAKQIEAARQAITRKIKRKGKVWVRIFPDQPITSKPTEVRMGKGKGAFSHWAAKIRGGSIIFEVCGINLKTALKAFRTGGAKLPVKTTIFF